MQQINYKNVIYLSWNAEAPGRQAVGTQKLDVSASWRFCMKSFLEES